MNQELCLLVEEKLLSDLSDCNNTMEVINIITNYKINKNSVDCFKLETLKQFLNFKPKQNINVLLLNTYELLNETEKSIIKKMKPEELCDLIKKAIMDIISISSKNKGIIMESFVNDKCDLENVSNKSFYSDFRKKVKGGYIYIEVKNYKSNIPTKEIEKFYRDIDIKVDAKAGILVGGNVSKLLYTNGIPILIINNYSLLNDCINMMEIILSYNHPKREVVQLINSINDIGSLIIIIDEMTKNFLQNRDILRGKILIFQERCKKLIYEMEENEIKKEELMDFIKDKKYNIIKNELVFNYIMDIIDDNIILTKNMIIYKTIKFTLLSTKTKITFPIDIKFIEGLEGENFIFDGKLITFDLTPSNFNVVKKFI